MGKIRVKDLARKMGMGDQDLLFKLRAIGVRLESPESPIDADMIQAILQGRRLPQPREVILRDDSGKAPAPPPPRPQESPSRPQPIRRGRRMIQRVDQRIRTIERSQERPFDRPEEVVEETPAVAEAPAAAEPAAPAEVAEAAPAAVEATPAEAPAEPPAPAAEAPQPEAPAAKPPAAKPAAAKPAAEAKPEGTRPPGKKKTVQAVKPAKTVKTLKRTSPATSRRPAEIPRASRSLAGKRKARRPSGPHRPMRRRPMAPSEPVPQMKPVSERGKRRAKRREEGTADPAFKSDRPDGPVTVTEGMTVRDLADKLGVKSKDLIRSLFNRGIMATINQTLEPDLAIEVAADFDIEAMAVTYEEEVQLRHESVAEADTAKKAGRPPVITVMGHVDHGKTTLLDRIRQANVAEGEAGGITQHIGAYHVDSGGQRLVFLDTPGHEAFTLMRARGAQVTDIVVLVVAADDGVMPQTKEAIDHAIEAEVPIIVAINKVDKANANPDRVKKELADHGLLVEDWGGDIVSVPLSALKGDGISDLLEMIAINSEILELKAAPDVPAQGAVLEARKEVGRGMIATVLVQDGTLQRGDIFVAGSVWGKVRTMTDDHGNLLREAPPSTPVEVTGFNDLPAAGDLFQVVPSESEARSIAEFRQREIRQRELAPSPSRMSLEQLFDQIDQGETKELPVIVKADVQGSVEVLRDTLHKLSTDKVELRVIHSAVGAITTNDVILATASRAVIVGFNVRPERNASAMAEQEGIDIRLHTVIFELTEEIKKAMAGLLEPTFREVQKGVAEVREIFKVPKVGMVAGCHVTEGVIPRNGLTRVLRDNKVIYEGRIGSLRRFKEDVAEVRTGFECGIGLDQYQDVKPGDLIEAFVKEEVAAAL